MIPMPSGVGIILFFRQNSKRYSNPERVRSAKKNSLVNCFSVEA